jgi:ankyrin repeat protein
LLKLLLDFHTNHLPRPRNRFISWFTTASLDHKEELAQLLIDFSPGGESMLSNKHLDYAFRGNNEAIIKATLTRLNLTNFDAGTIITMPLFMAIRSGKLTAVRLVLEAGADPNVMTLSNIESLKKLNISPLGFALYQKNTDIARYLLEHGATVPHVSEWLIRRPSFDFVRDWETEHTSATIPTWSEAWKLRLSGSLKDLKY